MVGGSFLIAQCMCGHVVCGHFVVNSVFHIRSSNGSEQWSMKINISVNRKQFCTCVCVCVTHVRRSISVGLSKDCTIIHVSGASCFFFDKLVCKQFRHWSVTCRGVKGCSQICTV